MTPSPLTPSDRVDRDGRGKSASPKLDAATVPGRCDNYGGAIELDAG
jgi:hypothetical protein